LYNDQFYRYLIHSEQLSSELEAQNLARRYELAASTFYAKALGAAKVLIFQEWDTLDDVQTGTLTTSYEGEILERLNGGIYVFIRHSLGSWSLCLI
jgi:hypothetical protein